MDTGNTVRVPNVWLLREYFSFWIFPPHAGLGPEWSLYACFRLVTIKTPEDVVWWIVSMAHRVSGLAHPVGKHDSLHVIDMCSFTCDWE